MVGLGGIAGALGPFVGGYLIQAASSRLIFLINLPIAAAVVWVARRHVPETRDESVRTSPLDLRAAAVTALGLAAFTYGLTEGPQRGWGSPVVVGSILVGLAGLVAFILLERGREGALVPLELFSSRQFSSANAVTFVVYAALGGALFLLPIQLQQTVGFTPLEAGAALVPMTIVMLLLSARAGRLAQRIGPRLPMSAGPIIAAVGLVLLSRIDASSTYVATVLPGVVVFALGLSLTVAPLTSTVLSAGGEAHAGSGCRQQRGRAHRRPHRRRRHPRRSWDLRHRRVWRGIVQRRLLPGNAHRGGRLRRRRPARRHHDPQPASSGRGAAGPVLELPARRPAPARPRRGRAGNGGSGLRLNHDARPSGRV